MTKQDYRDPQEALGQTMFSVLKPWHQEGKRRVREHRRRQRPKSSKPNEEKVTLKEAVFRVVPGAVAHVSGNGRLPYSARRLLYRVRAMIQQYTSAELTESYFRDNLLQQYQREHGKLEGLYYEARGSLYEPHDGRTMDVGTREVEAYETPPHLYNKILFVEKRGQYPLLKSARLMERYDMAILTSQGFATTAARTLLEDADKSRTIQIFCLHDADPKGYNIAHTIREATERMPEYSVQVIDLGLTIEQGLALGIEPENFNRDKALDKRVLKHLDPSSPAWEFFGANRPQDKNVPCKRIELDALTGPQAIALIEEGLNAEGVYGKVVPSEEELPSLAEGRFRALHARWVKEALHEVVGLPALQRALAEEFIEAFKLENSERYIGARFRKDDALSWKGALDDVLQDIHDAKLRDALKDAVREAAREALSADGDE